MDNTSPPNPNPMLPQNDELGMPAPVMFQPDYSRRNRILAVVILLILLAGGGAIWWFALRDKPVKPAAQNTNTSQHQNTTTPAANHTIYLARANREGSTDVQRLNTSSGDVTAAGNRKDGYMAYTQLADGTMRTLTNQAANDADGTNRSNVILQDGDAAPKTIYSEITSNKADTVSKTFWPSAMNADGSKVYFYERDNLTSAQRVSTVDTKGTVTDIITYKAADGKTGLGQFKGTITPGHVSKDEKTIYFNVHSCLNCDGPSYADVVAYDVTTKTFQQPFIDPNYETAKAEGYWTKLSDDLFVVRSDTLNMNFLLPGYETMIAKEKNALYLFDTRTNKATKVFESDANNFDSSPLGLSSDGKTFYYYTQKINQDSALVNEGDATEGHEFHFSTSQIRAYTVATAKTAAVELSIDPTPVQPTFLTSNGTSYLYATAGRNALFSGLASTEPYVVYASPMKTPTEKKTVLSVPSDDIYGFTYLGFSTKQ